MLWAAEGLLSTLQVRCTYPHDARQAQPGHRPERPSQCRPEYQPASPRRLTHLTVPVARARPQVTPHDHARPRYRAGCNHGHAIRDGCANLSASTTADAVQTTNLGVGSSNLSGRATLLHSPCESHGIHTVQRIKGHSRGIVWGTAPCSVVCRPLFRNEEVRGSIPLGSTTATTGNVGSFRLLRTITTCEFSQTRPATRP